MAQLSGFRYVACVGWCGYRQQMAAIHAWASAARQIRNGRCPPDSAVHPACPERRVCVPTPAVRSSTGRRARPTAVVRRNFVRCRTGHSSIAYSITSLASTNSRGGTVRPSVVAVLRLMTSSNLVGCCTGRSVGLAPLGIVPTTYSQPMLDRPERSQPDPHPLDQFERVTGPFLRRHRRAALLDCPGVVDLLSVAPFGRLPVAEPQRGRLSVGWVVLGVGRVQRKIVS